MSDTVRAELDAERVRDWMGLDPEFSSWLNHLASVGVGATPASLPSGADCVDLLLRMQVPEADAREAIEVMPSAESDPELWWILERCVHAFALQRENPTGRTQWPTLPPRLGTKGRYFYLFVFAAGVPSLLEWHAARGIPEEVSWATLADVGEKVVVHRLTHGIGGLDKQFWLQLHFHGSIYTLGRLQYEMAKAWSSTASGDGGPDLGEPVLSVHITETGPLTPADCDASDAWAREFFPKCFPEFRARFMVCESWLLDDQLAAYLPETSNIIKFQRRFALTPKTSDGDSGVLEFVFHHLGRDLHTLPRKTSLERAVLSHLDAGKHWLIRSGWAAL